MASKKTTLMIEEGLYSSIRQRAAQRGLSVSSIVSEAIAAYISPKGAERKAKVKLPVATGGGWIGPVDSVSNRELLDPLDDAEDLDRLR
jgi:hypothetical protein